MTASPRRVARLRPFVLAAAVAAALVSPAAAAAEDLTLDTHNASADGNIKAVTTSAPLAAGQPYTITVQGTYSNVSARRWTVPLVCGTPEAAPMFPSPGIENGPVGFDAMVAFARTQPVAMGCSSMPFAHYRFKINLGNGYLSYVPVTGQPTEPRPDHRYTFAVVGRGANASFRLNDTPAYDNYGILQISVNPS